jgi:hypothetical protein
MSWKNKLVESTNNAKRHHGGRWLVVVVCDFCVVGQMEQQQKGTQLRPEEVMPAHIHIQHLIAIFLNRHADIMYY